MNLESLLRRKVLLKDHCTLKIGGPADFFAEPCNEKEIAELLTFVKQNSIPYFVIGNGSNLLFDDEGFRGLIIKIGPNFSKINIENDVVIAQAGAWMPYIARKAQTAGLSGLEHTVGIPGNLGGLLVMNGGSKRQSISENILSVRVMNKKKEIFELSAKECGFAYRQSSFKRNELIILAARLKCSLSKTSVVRADMLKILKERREKFPLKEPNCGSVFKSEPEIYEKYGPPGKIIENLGLKGMRFGDIEISAKHANFFVNKGKGTCSNYLNLINFCKTKILKALGVVLKVEVDRAF